MNVAKITNGERIFSSSECYVCKKSFKYKSQLTIHIGTHSSEKPYKYFVCYKDLKENII